jgi:hypothetical protein
MSLSEEQLRQAMSLGQQMAESEALIMIAMKAHKVATKAHIDELERRADELAGVAEGKIPGYAGMTFAQRRVAQMKLKAKKRGGK